MCSISLTKVFFSSTSLRMAAEKWNVFPPLSKLTKLDFLSSATSSFSLCTSSSPPQFVFLLGLRLVFVMFHILTFLPMTSSHSFLALISLFSLENATIIKSFLFALWIWCWWQSINVKEYLNGFGYIDKDKHIICEIYWKLLKSWNMSVKLTVSYTHKLITFTTIFCSKLFWLFYKSLTWHTLSNIWCTKFNLLTTVALNT